MKKVKSIVNSPTLHKIIAWSEKYTKTDMRYLLRGSFWSVVGQASAILCTLSLATVIGHYLPQEEYGQYKYVLSIIAILSSLSLTGIGQAVFQSVAHGYDGALSDGFKLNIKWSIFILIGSFFLSIYYITLHNNSLAIAILIGGSLSPILTSATLSSSFLGAKKDFARQTIYFDIIENIIPVIALIVTILLTDNFIIIVSVFFLSNTLVTLYLYYKTVKKYTPDSKNTDSDMLSYAKHLSFMGILGGVANNIDQILLFHYFGAVELAIYNFAIALPNQFKGPTKMLDSMFQAKFAERSENEIHKNMQNKVWWLFFASIVTIVLYILLAPVIFKLFFPLYSSAVIYSQFYALSLLSLAFTPSASYLAIKK